MQTTCVHCRSTWPSFESCCTFSCRNCRDTSTTSRWQHVTTTQVGLRWVCGGLSLNTPPLFVLFHCPAFAPSDAHQKSHIQDQTYLGNICQSPSKIPGGSCGPIPMPRDINRLGSFFRTLLPYKTFCAGTVGGHCGWSLPGCFSSSVVLLCSNQRLDQH